MREVATTGRQAIGEMRRLVGTLRVDDPADRYPVPGLAQLDELLGQVRAAGLPVRLVVTGRPQPLGQGAELAVYRIVQEALTNARKHAVDATGAVVRLRYEDEGIDVEVTDDGRPAPVVGDAGHGLTGMRERAAAYGGTVEAGPGPEGGWLVHARLRLGGIEAP
jgi:signal transduction histidine kinase